MVRALSLRLAYQVIGALVAPVFGTLTTRWLGPHDKGFVSPATLIAFPRNRNSFTAGEIFAGLAWRECIIEILIDRYLSVLARVAKEEVSYAA
jgi:hypothetical protein